MELTREFREDHVRVGHSIAEFDFNGIDDASTSDLMARVVRRLGVSSAPAATLPTKTTPASAPSSSTTTTADDAVEHELNSRGYTYIGNCGLAQARPRTAASSIASFERAARTTRYTAQDRRSPTLRLILTVDRSSGGWTVTKVEPFTVGSPPSIAKPATHTAVDDVILRAGTGTPTQPLTPCRLVQQCRCSASMPAKR